MRIQIHRPSGTANDLNWLVDHEIDLSVFDARYRNDEVGAAAYHPGVLLNFVLLGYASGTRAELARKAEKMEKAVAYLLDTYRRQDSVKQLGKPGAAQYRHREPQTAGTAAVTMNRFARPTTTIKAQMRVPPSMARLRECATAIVLQPRCAP